MAIEFRLPELGEGIATANLVKVLVSVGDTVALDQIVLEIETDKAAIEVPSPVAGVVKDVHVKAGDKVQVGQKVFTLDAKTTAKESPAPAPEPVPEESTTGVEPSGPAPVSEPSTPLSPASMPSTTAPTGSKPASPPKPAAPASPSVRRLAREIGLDINQIQGSGPGGRISIEDVKRYSRRVHSGEMGIPGLAAETVALPDFSIWGGVERKTMSNVRRLTMEHMSNAWRSIPHVTQFDRADITRLEAMRQQYAPKAEAAGGKLTVTAILLKILASALKRYPQFNSSLDVAQKEIVYKKYYHIGVAVDTDRGLMVPVIRNVDRKSIIELSAELNEIAQKTRNGKTSLDEMRGGSFTVTNLGGIGGVGFTPIVNWPEVAILGVARATTELALVEGEIAQRTMLPLALSYDHRVIDGADGARFLRWVAEALEQPFLLALEG